MDMMHVELQVPIHVPHRAQRVVRRQEDLGAVAQRLGGVGRYEGRRVAHHRRLDLRLARRDDPRIEVDLGREAECLLERGQEAHARDHVAHLRHIRDAATSPAP